MRVKESNSYFINRLIISVQNYLSINIAFLCLFLLIRTLELFLINNFNDGIDNAYQFFVDILRFDLIYFFNIQLFISIPFILLGIFLDFRFVNFLMYIFVAFVLLVYSILIVYFSKSLTPLGAEFLDYTEADLKQTIGASGVLNIYTIALTIIAFVLFIYIPGLFTKINWHTSVVVIFLGAIIASLFLTKYSSPNPRNYPKLIDYQISLNKLQYIGNSLNEKFKQSNSIAFDGFYFDDDFASNSEKYIDPDNYPFLHADSTADVLSPFLNKADRSPNFVFIIVEGLGRSYSGKDAELGSFTPFLDSLSEHSLYWENFLSNGGRTFAVLPSLFASAPFSAGGFLELGEQMPEHQSLLKLAKLNGYRTGFYHGGEITFDKMDIFLRRQLVDEMVGSKDYPANYSTMPKAPNGFTWGYGDKEVFNNYFRLRKNAKDLNTPRMDVFLTLSTHNPFKVANLKYYNQKFENRLTEIGIDNIGRSKYSSYKDIYSTVMYTDDAIRNFINEYKKRSDFKNTIFIITGDHRMPEIPLNTNLDRFYVPLIIYSPLLNRTASFKGVSSHLDITPSILAYLRINYGLKKPKVQAWVGSNLDTSRFFNSSKFIPLKRNKNEFVDYIDRGLYYSKGEMYRISDNFKQSIPDDQVAVRLAQAKYEEYLRKRDKTFSSNKIVPDSVLNFKIDK